MRLPQRAAVLAVLGAALAAVACAPAEEPPVAGRWYTASQVARGEQVFGANCAVCHGARAEGTADWKRRLPDGSLPPPPLNGTAHAWHHDIETLLRTIERGGLPLGGTMPAFGAVLDRDQRLAAIAYFQSQWDEEVYRLWQERGR